MSDFKPCPFCGSDNLIIDSVEDGGGWAVKCQDCSANGTPSYSMNADEEKHVIIDKWNTRHEAAKVAEQPEPMSVEFLEPNTLEYEAAISAIKQSADQPDGWTEAFEQFVVDELGPDALVGGKMSIYSAAQTAFAAGVKYAQNS